MAGVTAQGTKVRTVTVQDSATLVTGLRAFLQAGVNFVRALVPPRFHVISVTVGLTVTELRYMDTQTAVVLSERYV